ncbi:MAG: CBS domain-containing protein [Anaerolineae bacterium]|nr:CBS domain-containing protein [Anaerolineae bacterium]
MLVGDRMTRDVVTVLDGATVAEGLRLMDERGVNRLPVVDAEGRLSGIVSDMDLRIAEAAGGLADRIRSVMTTRLVTISEYCTLEKAATLMRQKGVGGLPVVRGSQLVGIITDGDVFDAFTHLLGADQPGVRLTVEVPNSRTVVTLLDEITKAGGDILGLGIMSMDAGRRLLAVKVSGISTVQAQAVCDALGLTLTDLLEEH